LPEDEKTRLLAELVQTRNGATVYIPLLKKASELYDQHFAPLDFLVDGLLAKGNLAMLGGRPKSGKSWLVLQLAKAIDTGEEFLGRPTKCSRVLYITLEDGDRRVHQRMAQLKWRANEACVLFEIAKFDAADGDVGPGLKQLELLAAGYDLIIIDTLIACISGKANENDNAQMGAIVNELARIAHSTNTTVLVTHHTNKGTSEDPFNSLRGASSLRGAYDVGIVLMRKLDKREAMLHIESRDFDTCNMRIRQNDDGAGWEFIGGLDITSIRAGRRSVQAMVEHGDGCTAAELAKVSGVSARAVRSQLTNAEKHGLVRREAEQLEHSKKPVYRWYLQHVVRQGA
jgi:hypothetical protein